MASLSVAGNLLLCGEYAILEEGGLGLAVAVEPRVRVRIDSADELSVTARWGNERTSWTGSRRIVGSSAPSSGAQRSIVEGGTLIEAVHDSFEKWRRDRNLPQGCAAGRIEVDSSALYGSRGEKLGFGSSAAVAVALAAAFMRLAEPGDVLRDEELFSVAIAGHRAFQGGSGYDVAASAYGGIGLFTGGSCPSYRRVHLPWFRPFRVTHSSHPVRTPDAVGRYRSWKASHTEEARSFLARSNQNTAALVNAVTWEQARGHLLAAKELGEWLGERIGVPASVEVMRFDVGASRSPVVKALGAGNEVAAIWSDEAVPGAGDCVAVAERSLEWSE